MEQVLVDRSNVDHCPLRGLFLWRMAASRSARKSRHVALGRLLWVGVWLRSDAILVFGSDCGCSRRRSIGRRITVGGRNTVTLGVLLTKWTIWAALVGYAGGAAGLIVAGRRKQGSSLARKAWTLGCIAYLAHVFCAFEFYHDWSHTAALRETARQTREAVGWEVGEGLFVSYLFTLAWPVDVIWWWLVGAENYGNRMRWLTGSVQVFFLFMVLNAAVVFESGPVRWLGLTLCVGLAALWWSTKSKTDVV